MDFNLTIYDLLLLILSLFGIGVGIFLILGFIKAKKIIGTIGELLDENRHDIDATTKIIPDITYNMDRLKKQATTLTTNLKPEIDSLMTNVSSISEKFENTTSRVENVTEKAQDIYHGVSHSLIGSFKSFRRGSKGIKKSLRKR